MQSVEDVLKLFLVSLDRTSLTNIMVTEINKMSDSTAKAELLKFAQTDLWNLLAAIETGTTTDQITAAVTVAEDAGACCFSLCSKKPAAAAPAAAPAPAPATGAGTGATA